MAREARNASNATASPPPPPSASQGEPRRRRGRQDTASDAQTGRRRNAAPTLAPSRRNVNPNIGHASTSAQPHRRSEAYDDSQTHTSTSAGTSHVAQTPTSARPTVQDDNIVDDETEDELISPSLPITVAAAATTTRPNTNTSTTSTRPHRRRRRTLLIDPSSYPHATVYTRGVDGSHLHFDYNDDEDSGVPVLVRYPGATPVGERIGFTVEQRVEGRRMQREGAAQLREEQEQEGRQRFIDPREGEIRFRNQDRDPRAVNPPPPPPS